MDLSRSSACACVAVVAAMVLAPTASAQPSAPVSADTFDCRMLARMPNAPMTVETCEKRMAAHLELMAALETPGGERAGDGRLGCDAIEAEMRAMGVVGVSAGNAAEGQAAGRSVMAILHGAMAEAIGMASAQAARSAAAAAVPGNAAGHAAATANMAEQTALQGRTGAQLGPARERLEAANVSSIGDLVKAMRAQPRFARLIRLGMERGCSGS